MGEYTSVAYKKAARIQTIVCGFLFFVFSFLYLYVFQNDILEALHYSLAHGKTSFAPLSSALILSAILLCIRWGINSLLGLRIELNAFSYIPSCLFLGVLTDVNRDVYMSDSHSFWCWALPLALLGYVGIALGIKRLVCCRNNAEMNSLTVLNWNLFGMLVLFGMTIGISNTDRGFHHELAVERYLRKREYEKALNVGIYSLKASRTLTALRGYTLACAGAMGDRLFQYPQYYGSDGLFFRNDSLAELRYTNDSISYLLGVHIEERRNKKDFLHDICYNETGTHLAADYYLSALLLDKDLYGFINSVSELKEDSIHLPRYYQEAILLFQSKHPDYKWETKDSLMYRRFEDYLLRKKELSSQTGEKNWMRRDFGDTYWWYFDYQE